MQYIKGGFSFRFKSKTGVWERGYNEAQIRTLERFEACRRYIEQNPVRAHLSATAEEFAYSSANCTAEIDPVPGHFAKRDSNGPRG